MATAPVRKQTFSVLPHKKGAKDAPVTIKTNSKTLHQSMVEYRKEVTQSERSAIDFLKAIGAI